MRAITMMEIYIKNDDLGYTMLKVCWRKLVSLDPDLSESRSCRFTIRSCHGDIIEPAETHWILCFAMMARRSYANKPLPACCVFCQDLVDRVAACAESTF